MTAARKLWELDDAELDDVIASLTPEQTEFILHDWLEWGRPDQVWYPQLSPGAMYWLWCCGRGWGKTRTGAEAARYVGENPIEYFGHRDVSKWRGVLVGRTAADVRGTMLYGPSGIMTITPKADRPLHLESKNLLIWPSGVQMLTFSADKADQLRGPTFGFAWADELCAWKLSRRPEMPDAWDNLIMGLREKAVGGPRVVVTTTPRMQRHLAKLIERHKEGDQAVRVVFGSTYDNAANLAKESLREYEAKYAGTRLERQELHGELLLDNPNSLWPDASVFSRVEVAPKTGESYVDACWRVLDLTMAVVAVDPSVSGKPGSCETGIVVVGRSRKGRYCVLDDVTQDPAKFAGRTFEKAWAKAAVDAARRWRAHAVIGEKNNGGALVEANIRAYVEGESDGQSEPLRYGGVWASDNKRTRADPISLLYEQGRVIHVGPPRRFLALEAACQDFDPSMDPREQTKPVDRMDALVWGVTFLQDQTVVRDWSILGSEDVWELDEDTLAVFR